jgi:hypothetical protein
MPLPTTQTDYSIGGTPALVFPTKARSATGLEVFQLVVASAALCSAALEARLRLLRPCESPLPLDDLRAAGLPDALLLWMLFQGHCERFPARPGAQPRLDLALPSLPLTPTSAFALTPAGEEFVAWLLAGPLFSDHEEQFARTWSALAMGDLLPHYDRERRVFRWGRHLIKCFRQPSTNQEIILCSAEELGWPEWFDDPLPGPAGTNPKMRLHDTIKDLNRRQKMPLIRFKGDGTGTRIGWEFR